MPAQVAEKVCIAPDSLPGKHGFDCAKQQGFGLVVRLIRCKVINCGRQLQCFECLAVYLAREQARQRWHKFIAYRHHVGRQAHFKRIAQMAGSGRRLGVAVCINRVLGHYPCHQLVNIVDFAHQHGGCANTCLLAQRRFNLAQLYAKAAYFYLVICPPQTLHRAVFLYPRQVTRAIQAAFVGMGCPRVGQKFFSRQFWSPQIPLRHARANDAQLARIALWHGLLLLIKHQHAVVGQRPAYGYGLISAQTRQTGRYGRLSGAIGVKNLQAVAVKPCHQRIGAHLAAQIDDAQARHIGAKQRQQRRHSVQHGNALLLQGAGQGIGVAHYLFGRNPQRSAHQI